MVQTILFDWYGIVRRMNHAACTIPTSLVELAYFYQFYSLCGSVDRKRGTKGSGVLCNNVGNHVYSNF